MKVLAIGAHPDDVEIFAFGSLMVWWAMGADVSIAVATDGAAGGPMRADALRARRADEARAAAAPLGTQPRFLNFPDGRLMADRALDDALRALLRDINPDLILTHAPEDYHADHRALAVAVSQAANFTTPVLQMDTMGGTGFIPTHWVDVTAHFVAKCTAIRAHASQEPERFVALATRQAAFRAGECNAPPEARAEAFRFTPRFPFADIRALLPPAPPVRPMTARSGG